MDEWQWSIPVRELYFTFGHRRIAGEVGSALYINMSIYLIFLKCIDICAEIVFAEINMNNGENIIVASVYRAPNTDLSLLKEYVEYILSNCNNKTVWRF